METNTCISDFQMTERDKKEANRKRTFSKYCIKIMLVTTCLAVLFGVAYIFFKMENGYMSSSLVEELSDPKSSALSGLLSGSGLKGHTNIALKQDFKLQECDGPFMKYSFPDIDYALLGYNILRGYPENFGHDPGFTFPIFMADYTKGRQTADCRYWVPEGLLAIPDISCENSFSSEIIQTSYELSKSLSLTAKAEFHGFGIQFAASAGFKKSSSAISTGESVIIKTTAKCRYYFVKLMQYQIPKFSADFISWVHNLDKSCNEETYYNFFQYFGTHYPTETYFGAKLTFENIMSSDKYTTIDKTENNVEVSANYAGSFSLNGGYSMDASQQEKASNFKKQVTTRTITIGAPPPANGDAMTWASTVKDSPVPVKYELSFIGDLFSERYMSNLKVNYNAIRTRLTQYAGHYCISLQSQGQVDSCSGLSSSIELTATKLMQSVRFESSRSIAKCISACTNHVACEAISYCTKCVAGDNDFQKCYMFTSKAVTLPRSSHDLEWTSVIFTGKITDKLSFKDVQIIGINIQDEMPRARSLEECNKRCLNTVCMAYTYCNCTQLLQNCFLYASGGVSRFHPNKNYSSVFPSFTKQDWNNERLKC